MGHIQVTCIFVTTMVLMFIFFFKYHYKDNGFSSQNMSPVLHLNPFKICSKGQPLVDKEFQLEQLAQFIKVYEQRPAENKYGTKFAHQFALWSTVRKLCPLHIIESGIYQGMGTWILRQATPDAQIILLDPSMSPLVYRDTHTDTIYLTGPQFTDFEHVDWKALNLNMARTLVFFDDHQAELKRTKQAFDHGFKFIMFDDNYSPPNYDNFSLKIACGYKFGLYDKNDVPYKDYSVRRSRPVKHADLKLIDFVFQHVIKSYFEFHIPWSNDDINNNTLVKNNNRDGAFQMKNPNVYFLHPQFDFVNICLVELVKKKDL